MLHRLWHCDPLRAMWRHGCRCFADRRAVSRRADTQAATLVLAINLVMRSFRNLAAEEQGAEHDQCCAGPHPMKPEVVANVAHGAAKSTRKRAL
jgi:hypothetical protein